jgi:DNA polymerase (family 10)
MAKNGGAWPHEVAMPVAEMVVRHLEPYCERIEIAGSLRRKRPVVHDIDIVTQPYEGQELAMQMALGFAEEARFAPKIWSLKVGGISVDLYLAGPEQFATLLLVRTGSAKHNISLASRARAMGLALKASGDGIFRGDERVAWESEEALFGALGMEYIEPEAREV